MTASRVRPAFVTWLLAVLLIVLSGWILLPFPRRPTGWEEVVWTIAFSLGFTSVGAILVDRRPREPVSRITLAIGLTVVASVGLRAFAVALDARPGDLPVAGALAALASQELQTLAFLAAGGFLLVRFPNGRQGDRLTVIVDALVALIAAGVLLQSLVPGRIDLAWLSAAENPIGVALLDQALFDSLGGLVLAAYAASLGLALVVIVRRYRRSDPVTRAQIRWVVAAGAVPVLLVPLVLVADWVWTLWFLSTTLLPVAIGIAILRYRLYAIDRIIGRTLAYAIVTAVLAGLFVVTNISLQSVVASAIGGGTLAVAVSTLVVAALFQPIRRRVQAPIDRRFNRAHVNAERLVGSFALRVGDEVDLPRLRSVTLATVTETLGPRSADVWLRGEGRPR